MCIEYQDKVLELCNISCFDIGVLQYELILGVVLYKYKCDIFMYMLGKIYEILCYNYGWL